MATRETHTWEAPHLWHHVQIQAES